MSQIIDRVIGREAILASKMRGLHPLVETYLQSLDKDDDLAFHPSMTGIAELLQDNAVCVVQGVGYPNPSQSHFRSMDIWQAGATAEQLTEGWIGKALKQLKGAGSFHLKSANEKAPLAVEGAPVRVPSITTLEEFQLQAHISPVPTAAVNSSRLNMPGRLLRSMTASDAMALAGSARGYRAPMAPRAQWCGVADAAHAGACR